MIEILTKMKVIKDFLNMQSTSFQQQTQVSNIVNAIGYDPARMSSFLGHQILNNKPTTKLETIHENIPTTTSNVRILLKLLIRFSHLNI